MKRRLTTVCKQTEKLSWRSELLGELHDCPVSVLSLDRILPAGQAFRWKKLTLNNGLSLWRGVIGKFIVDLSQNDSTIKVVARSSVVKDADINPILMIRNYFNLQVDYRKLIDEWAAKDVNFANESLDVNGARVLAVEPVEALFSFICSSNNNVPRISKMVSNLAQLFGEKIGRVEDVDYYAFPTPADLIGDDVEQKLRAAGFGYRAGYIVKTARQVEELGGEKWLLELQHPSVPYSVAVSKLLQLTGVGRKVADCVCLIGLGKFEAVPIDTHIFQVANKLYKIPCLISDASKKNKNATKATVSPKIYQEICEFFRSLWGSYCGWAQQILFTQRVRDRHTT